MTEYVRSLLVARRVSRASRGSQRKHHGQYGTSAFARFWKGNEGTLRITLQLQPLLAVKSHA